MKPFVVLFLCLVAFSSSSAKTLKWSAPVTRTLYDRTISFTTGPGSANPFGPAPDAGSLFIFVAELRETSSPTGPVVGFNEGTCNFVLNNPTTATNTYSCTGTITFTTPGGSRTGNKLTFSGSYQAPVDGLAPTFARAINGGTGNLIYASGQLVSTPTPDYFVQVLTYITAS